MLKYLILLILFFIPTVVHGTNPILEQYNLPDVRLESRGVTVLWSTGFCDIDDPNQDLKLDILEAAGILGFRAFTYVSRTYTESPWLRVDNGGVSQLDDGTGRFNLMRWNERWWDHFDGMLYKATVERKLYVIISVFEECQIRHKQDGNVALRSNINGIIFNSHAIKTFNSFSDPTWNNVRENFMIRIYKTAERYFYTNRIVFETVNEPSQSCPVARHVYNYYTYVLGYRGRWVSSGCIYGPNVLYCSHGSDGGFFPSTNGTYRAYDKEIEAMAKAFRNGTMLFECWDRPGMAGYSSPTASTSRYQRRRQMFNKDFFINIRRRITEPLWRHYGN